MGYQGIGPTRNDSGQHGTNTGQTQCQHRSNTGQHRFQHRSYTKCERCANKLVWGQHETDAMRTQVYTSTTQFDLGLPILTQQQITLHSFHSRILSLNFLSSVSFIPVQVSCIGRHDLWGNLFCILE